MLVVQAVLALMEGLVKVVMAAIQHSAPLRLLVEAVVVRMPQGQATLEVPAAADQQITALVVQALQAKVFLVEMLHHLQGVSGQVTVVVVAVQAGPEAMVKQHQQLAHKVVVLMGYNG